MTEEAKARIFNDLFTNKGVGQGTGRELAITRQIIDEKHSGMIMVNFEMGQGTELLVLLPLQ
ncbi:MAG: sensor histidine kinase [Oscillatoriales cyanobacterium]|nr:MAG: sensor histidine kinase [Oscillatoriales cyanobacterium]